MMTKEEYKREVVRMWDSLRATSFGEKKCTGVICEECPLYDTNCESSTNAFEMIEIVEKWSNENPSQKHKVSQLEYDILKSYLDYKNHMTVDIAYYFFEDGLLLSLLKKGYFKGADGEMEIEYYFKNCEVVDNDD